MDYTAAIVDIILLLLVLGFVFRKRLRAWLSGKRLSRESVAMAAAVTSEPPQVSPVTPKDVTLKPKQTTVQPAQTNVAGVVNGGFTEWAIPTAASGPLGINGIGSTVVFTEYNTGKIATLSVGTASTKH